MKIKQDHRETLYTIDKKGKRKWVYAHSLAGPLTRLRTLVAWLLVLFYLSLPWITINDKQGVLLDIPHRRFIFFGLELWATDTIFLFLILATLGMSLFFFTSILGRVWCGWACPETVFLEFVFRPIERLIEGSDAERRRLDNAPWSAQKIFKKALKHCCCAAIAWVIASTALAYFIGREPLLEMMTNSPLQNPVPFFMTLVVMAVMAFQFGWFREQFCTVLCPYARFQSVLMDPNSLLIGYDYQRGEPRGKVKASAENKTVGDCVDCGLCQRVCPTGIDIRNGTQLECIACSACADACDSIMLKIGRAKGLIRYTTENELQGKKTQWIRPRLFVYISILAILVSSFFYKLNSRNPIDVDLIRVSKIAPFSLDEKDIVTNQFSLQISNKSAFPEYFSVTVVEPNEISAVSPIAQLEIKPGETQQVPLFVQAPLALLTKGVAKAVVDIVPKHAKTVRKEFKIIGPEK